MGSTISDYTTSTGESDHENKVTSNFDFNEVNLMAREHATFFKIQIADIEKENVACRRSRFKVRLLKHKLKQCLYEDSVSWFKVSEELEMKKKKAYKG
ncbi:hypothetical protein DVH24_020914 [Malus domestica]|uniref:Uncharacterized protein n=1 Tax=Malus domestica TaxID=3750 RepID=A0A498JEU8_MALDO|nr:hypothetical protein DVH24_020914 [Malus domestica]